MPTQKKVLLIILFVFFCTPHCLLTQNEKPVRVIVFTKSGNGFSGYLTEIHVGSDDDTLILYSAKQTVNISVNELSKVIVLPRGENGNYFLAGAFLGTYVSSLILGHGDQQPAGYLSEKYSNGFGLLASSLLGIGVGGGIGILMKSGTGQESVFDFNQNNVDNKNTRMKLYEIFSNKMQYKKLHFSVQGGHVYSRVKNKFQDITGVGTYGIYRKVAGEFNWLRKMQLTFSLVPNIEIGGAVQWSSEPKVSNLALHENFIGRSSLFYEQSYNVIGYYGIVKYKLTFAQIPREIHVDIGSGIGFAKIDYSRSAEYYTYVFNQPYIRTNSIINRVNRSSFSTLIFGECSYYFEEYLSVGLIADYVYFPPIKIPSFPTVNFPEQTLTGNACIGFNLGVHL